MINWLLGLFGALIGFLLRNLWQAVKDLQDSDKSITERMHGINALVAGSYLKRDEWHAQVRELFKKLDRIEDKLDQKADK